MFSEFTYTGTQQTLQQFAKVIGGSITNGNLAIQDATLKGFVHSMILEKGLDLSSWHMVILEDHIFRNHFEKPAGDATHLFCYYFQPQFDAIHLGERKNLKPRRGLPYVLAIHEQATVEFEFKKDSAIICLCIGVSAEWLQEHCAPIVGLQESWNDFYVREGVTFRQLSRSEFVVAHDLFEHLANGGFLLKLKSQVYQLLHLFLHFQTEHTSVAQNEGYLDIMTSIAQHIEQHLTSEMPPIAELAKMFYISPSTLQRQFKKVYGVNLYAYYIQRKMERAKQMLEESKSVSEVAALLRYESISHFIEIFRKHYGVSPGRIRSI